MENGKFYAEMFTANQRATIWINFTNINLELNKIDKKSIIIV